MGVISRYFNSKQNAYRSLLRIPPKLVSHLSRRVFISALCSKNIVYLSVKKMDGVKSEKQLQSKDFWYWLQRVLCRVQIFVQNRKRKYFLSMEQCGRSSVSFLMLPFNRGLALRKASWGIYVFQSGCNRTDLRSLKNEKWQTHIRQITR